MGRAGRNAALTLAALGVVLVVVYAFSPSHSVQAGCLALAAFVGITSMSLGPWLNRPRRPAPWRLFPLAAMAFLVGVFIRPWATVQTGVLAGTADVFTLTGYALLIVGLVLMLRSRGRLQPHAVTDGFIVCLGVAAAAIVVFSLPAAAILDRPAAISILAGIYPLLDVIMLLLLVNVGFSMPGGLMSFRAFAFATVMIFIGDVGYAWIGAQGRLTGSPLLDLPFILAYLGYGYSALHPSMREISEAPQRSVQPWSAVRLSLLVPALLLPVAVLAGSPSVTRVSRAVLASAIAGVIVAMVVRAVRAVHDHARGQEVLRRRATHDALTDLPNRTLLSERLQRMLATSTLDGPPVWLMYLDLDGFKLVNDTWGHETGDQLLIEVARRLATVAGPDITVARTGGDEFALTGQMFRGQAEDLANRVLASLEDPLEVLGLDLVATASLGLAEAGGYSSSEGLLRDADTAMYRAKSDGRNGWVIFDEGMQAAVRDRIEIELALRQALVRNQLWIAYQPIVELRTERVVGAEALLRWTHPIRGPIPPGDFIPVAEETGLISDIGAWVLNESVHQVAAWRRQGVVDEGFFVSVNASTRQLRDTRILDVIQLALNESGLPPECVVMEITESVMVEPTPAASGVLIGLRQLGVRLAVDDFGTGYSSLSYLSNYPVTGVKVDRAFVERLGGAVGDEVIVRAIAAMAGALCLSVVAEGVETEQQRDILRGIGVELGQGWLWGRAVGSLEFEQLYADAAAPAGGGTSYAQ